MYVLCCGVVDPKQKQDKTTVLIKHRVLCVAIWLPVCFIHQQHLTSYPFSDASFVWYLMILYFRCFFVRKWSTFEETNTYCATLKCILKSLSPFRRALSYVLFIKLWELPHAYAHDNIFHIEQQSQNLALPFSLGSWSKSGLEFLARSVEGCFDLRIGKAVGNGGRQSEVCVGSLACVDPGGAFLLSGHNHVSIYKEPRNMVLVSMLTDHRVYFVDDAWSGSLFIKITFIYNHYISTLYGVIPRTSRFHKVFHATCKKCFWLFNNI